jgi:hypothetical protein
LVWFRENGLEFTATVDDTKDDREFPGTKMQAGGDPCRGEISMRMKWVRGAILVCLILGLNGCMSFENVIHLKGDGSGTITQTILMNRQMLEQMSSLAGSFGGKAGNTSNFDKMAGEMFSEKQARDQAAKMGEGVSFVSSTPLTQGSKVGMKAVYAFQDITRLKLEMKPGGGLSQTPMLGEAQANALPVFRFQKLANGNSLLTLPLGSLEEKAAPEKKNTRKVYTNEDLAELPEKPGKTPNPAELEMARQMLGGMKFRVALEVEGQLIETNCPFVEANQVTLLNLDFDEMLKSVGDPAKLQGFIGKKPASLAEAQALMKELKGIQAPLVPEIRIEFAAVPTR